MKKVIKIGLIILGVILLSFLLLYFSGFNDTPKYDNKTVLDIRNKTNQPISGMYLSVVVPSTFTMPEGGTYSDEDIGIPDIKPHERVIVALDQKKIAVGGMKLQLTYNDYSEIIVDELHTDERYGDISSIHIVDIGDNDNIRTKEIRNYLQQKQEVFYYKHYSRVIEIN
ncbi:MAG: hypothetical protein PHE51_01850 [Eubacteriales bacterium]|nr:hypothetical protein [Eubacteriales bacterium]